MDKRKEIDEMEELEELGAFVIVTDEGEEVTLYAVDQTKVGGEEYLLATDTQEDGGNGFIFKLIPDGEDSYFLESVSDEESEYIAKIFAETANVDFEA